MQGIVIWTNPAAREAIIWCEDGGSLALAGPGTAFCLGGRRLQIGELVHAELRETDHNRFCLSLHRADARHLPVGAGSPLAECRPKLALVTEALCPA